MRFLTIGDEDMVLGFSLAGVEGKVVEGPDEAREVLREVLSDPDVGIIIISERIAWGMREEVDRYIYTHSFPLIIEVPDREGPVEWRKSIREMVRAAVGMSL